jgi:hypothetical protein
MFGTTVCPVFTVEFDGKCGIRGQSLQGAAATAAMHGRAHGHEFLAPSVAATGA